MSTARYLLNSGADISTHNDDEETALHQATDGNHLNLVCELLDGKADRNMRNKVGFTALGTARQFNYKDIALVLDDNTS